MSDKLWSACPAFFLPLPCFCSTPHRFDFLFHSLSSLFHFVCFGHPLTRRKIKRFFFLYCSSTASTLPSVGIQYSLKGFSEFVAIPKSLNFDIPLQLCTVFLSTDSVRAVNLIHHSLSNNAWTKLYSLFHRMLSTVKWHFDLKI